MHHAKISADLDGSLSYNGWTLQSGMYEEEDRLPTQVLWAVHESGKSKILNLDKSLILTPENWRRLVILNFPCHVENGHSFNHIDETWLEIFWLRHILKLQSAAIDVARDRLAALGDQHFDGVFEMIDRISGDHVRKGGTK